MIFRTVFITLWALLFGLSFVAPSAAEEKKVSIVYAAEMRLIDNAGVGDYAELATLLQRQRANQQATFFFFGGNSLGPSPMSTFDRGSHIIDILNSLEPDAMAAAKREFSYYEEELSLRAYEAAFPIVVSNLYKPSTNKNLDGLVDYAIIEKSGVKIGVLSVLNTSVVKEYLLTSVDIAIPEKAIIDKAEQMRDMAVDAVVLMHSYDFVFIDKLLKNKTIDLALMADPHIDLQPNALTNRHEHSVLISREGEVAEIELAWLKGQAHPEVTKVELVPLNKEDPEPKVQMQVLDYSKRLNRLLDEEIGMLGSSMDTRRAVVRGEESAFANFVADSLRSFFDTDVAIVNGGVIRGEQIYKANTVLSRRDIAKELPFRSRIVVLEVTGKTIWDAIENGLSQIENSKGRFLHFSGASIVFDGNAAPGQRLKKLSINGKPVEMQALYKLATSDYLASGGDDFSMLKMSKEIEFNSRLSPLMSEVVINNIRQLREISPKVEGRIINLAKEGQ